MRRPSLAITIAARRARFGVARFLHGAATRRRVNRQGTSPRVAGDATPWVLCRGRFFLDSVREVEYFVWCDSIDDFTPPTRRRRASVRGESFMSDQQDQAADGACSINRRGFLGTSAGIAAAASLGQGGEARSPDRAPRRRSRRFFPSGSSAARASRYRCSTSERGRASASTGSSVSRGRNGVRYVDTAQSYGSEPAIGQVDAGDAGDSQGVVPGHEGSSRHAARDDRQARRAARRRSRPTTSI